MKRRIIALVAALVIALLPMAAFAQTAVNNSGFQVQNLGTATANITIVYYKTDGTEAGRQQDTIPASSSKTYFGSTMQVAAGFNGSVVISSDQPVVAITNLVNASLVDSYGGFSGGATSLNLPLIQKNNGVDSWISVQNAGTADATISIAYTPGLSGSAGAPETATIKPGAAATFFQKNKADLGATFVGSAKVTSTNGQPIVAVVNQESPSGQLLLSYGGFTSAGSTTVAAPLVVANNFGQFTGIQIQNVGTGSADVTITYSPNTTTLTPAGGTLCPTPQAKVVTGVGAGATATVIQANGSGSAFDTQFATCTYVGSAQITSSQPLVVIVNQILGGSGSSYAGVDPNATTAAVSAPLIQANNFGTFSGIQVQNSGSSSTTVTVTYGPNSATGTPAGQQDCPTPQARSRTIDAGASFTFIQLGGTGDAFDSQFASCRYVGSATITAASGGKITAVVNQSVGGGLTDALSTYSAFIQQ